MNIVGVFWDIENCSVPAGKSAAKVAAKIRSLPVHQGKSEMEFLVVCDVTKTSEDIIDDLSSAQVNVQHVVAAKKKNAADEKLRQAMRRFVDSHSVGDRKTTLVLVSGDVDFVSDLSDFKLRKGVYVVLLHNRVASDVLMTAANEVFDFYTLMSTVPLNTAARPPFKFTELLVSNIPSFEEMSRTDTERKLEEVAKAWHGKVKYINDHDGTAVLKFENGDKTNRALKNMQGCMVGRRKIQLDYNRRLYENSRQKSPSPSNHRQNPSANVFNPRSFSDSNTINFNPRPSGIEVTKGRNATLRQVRCLSESSRDDSDTSGPATSGSNSSRRRRRRRKRNFLRSKPAVTSQDEEEVVEVIEKLEIRSKQENCEDENDDAVTMTITNICWEKNKKSLTEIKKMLLRLLFANGFQALSLDLKVAPSAPVAVLEDNYVATLQLPSTVSGSYFVHLIDGLPFGQKSLEVKFYESEKDDFLVGLPSSTPIGLVQYPDPDLIRSNSPNTDTYAESLCSRHDSCRSASLTGSFILPSVNVEMSVLRSSLETALRDHGERGIPLESLLECLNSVNDGLCRIEVVPNFGGVPLEQLIHDTNLIEIVERPGNVPYVISRRPDYSDRSRASFPLKNDKIEAFEKKILSLLEIAPCHRMEMKKLSVKYSKTFGSSYESDIKELGEEYRLSQDSFLIIGRKGKAMLVPSHKYLKTAFMLAVRRILAGLSDVKRLSTVNDAEFAGPFLRKFDKHFWIFNFGTCFLRDLFDSISQTDQIMLHFGEDFVELGLPLQAFVENSVLILLDKDAYYCSIKSFDEEYVTRFGHYSVPKMSYKSIVGLFKEFHNKFSVIESEKLILLSLSEKRRNILLQTNLRKLLKNIQANAVPLELLDDLYFQYFKRNLKPCLQFLLPDPSLDCLVKKFDDNDMTVNQGYLILNNGFFLKSFELKVISLLFHSPGLNHTMLLTSQFVPLYKHTFGERAYFDLDHLTSNCSFYFEFLLKNLGLPAYLVNIYPNVSIQIRDHIVKMCQIAKILKDKKNKVSGTELCTLYLQTFSTKLTWPNFKDLAEMLSCGPGFFSISADEFIEETIFVELGEGGRYFNTLTISENSVIAGLKEVSKVQPTKDAVKPKTKSRLAANFQKSF